MVLLEAEMVIAPTVIQNEMVPRSYTMLNYFISILRGEVVPCNLVLSVHTK